MCVIIIAPAGVDVSEEIIRRACARNGDGHGMSYLSGDGNFHVRKGFTADAAWTQWQKLPKDRDRVFHARLATHGNKDIANLHPYNATSIKGERRVFYHNGMLSIPRLRKDMSDSWHFAELLKKFETDKSLIEAVQDYAHAQQSRFAIHFASLDQVYMFGRGWVEKDGAHYSNQSALADPPKVTTYAGGYNEGYYGNGGIYSHGGGDWQKPGWDYKLIINPSRQTLPQGANHRRCDGFGQWWECTPKKQPESEGGNGWEKKVDGPYPGQVLWGPPDLHTGRGDVTCIVTGRKLGEYDLEKSKWLPPEIRATEPLDEEEVPDTSRKAEPSADSKGDKRRGRKRHRP